MIQIEKAGKRGETLAALYLMKKGYRVIRRNYFVRGGELDLICENNGILVFVEVKFRTTRMFGTPEEALTPVKIRRILRAIYHYRQKEAHSQNHWRLDFVGMEEPKRGTVSISHHMNILSDEWIQRPEKKYSSGGF